jgi:hypothetical protein
VLLARFTRTLETIDLGLTDDGLQLFVKIALVSQHPFPMKTLDLSSIFCWPQHKTTDNRACFLLRNAALVPTAMLLFATIAAGHSIIANLACRACKYL